jgi:hypothetical protein
MYAGTLVQQNKLWEHSLTHNKTWMEEQAVLPLQQNDAPGLKLSGTAAEKVCKTYEVTRKNV